MEDITFYELLQYYNKTVSAEEKERIEKIIAAQPYYKEVLDGLDYLEMSLKEKKEITIHLKEKKKNIKKKIFLVRKNENE